MFGKCELSNRQYNKASFTEKFGLVFVLTLENLFSQRFHSKANRKSIGSFKKRYQGFSKQPSIFCMLLCDNQEKFWLFSEHSLLVVRTKVENASFPYKTALLEANVKTNRMVITKWTYHKDQSFASNYFFFFFFENFVTV